MELTIQYTGQLASIVGHSEQAVNVPENITCNQLVGMLSQEHGTQFSTMLATDDGELRPSIMIIVGGEQMVGNVNEQTFQDGDTVMIMTPIAGG